jgi:hypothetical protein
MKLRSVMLLRIPLALAIAAFGCSTTSAEGPGSSESAVSGVPIGDVRGIVDISSTLRTRLLDDADAATASFDVSRVAGPVFRLRKQLGVFALEGTTSTYQGGTPTPLRATLWHQVAGRFATAIGDVCVKPGTNLTFVAYATGATGTPISPTTFRLQGPIADKIAAACASSGDEANRRQAVSSLWDAVMGVGGTLAAERAAFETEFAADGSPDVLAAPKERVTNMVLAMLLNPHFLLAK